jgi:hypothetical protein
MRLDELFFSDSEIDRLNVFRYLTTSETGTFKYEKLEDEFLFSFHQVGRILDEIDADLKQMDASCIKIVSGNGKFTIPENIPSMEHYRAFLIIQTVPMQFLIEVANYRENDVEDFCKRLGISRSTLSRKMVPLVEFCKSFFVKVTYTPMALVGDEIAIRMILLLIFWTGVRTEYWIFDEPITKEWIKGHGLTQDDAIKFLISEPEYLLVQELVYLTQAIDVHRVTHGHIVHPTKQMKELFDNNPNFPRGIRQLDIEFVDEFEHEQYSAFQYMLFISKAERFSFGIERLNGFENSEASNHPVMKFARKIVQYAHKKKIIPALTDDKEKLVTDSVCMSLVHDYSVGQTLPSTTILTCQVFTGLENYERNEFYMRDFFQKNKTELLKLIPHLNIDMLVEIILQDLLEFAYKGEVKKIRVGLLVERHISLNVNLRQFMETLGFCETEEYERGHKYDFVIYTSNDGTTKLNLPSFQWDMDYGKKEMMRVGEILFEMYITQFYGTESTY